MIEDLNEGPLHVCLCRETQRYVTHCFEADLIGDGNTEDEAISRLKKTIEIQYRVSETRNAAFCVDSVDCQWIECHQAVPLGNPGETTFTIPKLRRTSDEESIRVRMEIDKSPRILRNKDAWPSEYPLHDLIHILSTKKISWHISEEPDYGYFFGHWPAGSDGSVQSYPFFASSYAVVRWYHLKGIASRFGLNDLNL